jgi:hypothetical protein
MSFAHASVFGSCARARLVNTFLAVEQRILNQRSMKNTQWKADSVFFRLIPYLLDLVKCKGCLGFWGMNPIRLYAICVYYTNIRYIAYMSRDKFVYSANLMHDTRLQLAHMCCHLQHNAQALLVRDCTGQMHSCTDDSALLHWLAPSRLRLTNIRSLIRKGKANDTNQSIGGSVMAGNIHERTMQASRAPARGW